MEYGVCLKCERWVDGCLGRHGGKELPCQARATYGGMTRDVVQLLIRSKVELLYKPHLWKYRISESCKNQCPFYMEHEIDDLNRNEIWWRRMVGRLYIAIDAIDEWLLNL